MKLKKIPYYLLVLLLTTGPTLVIGFLSFGGMLALWACLPVAIGALVLSMAYEAEIYSQNIKGALNKLFFKRNYLQQEFANRFLLDNFPDIKADNCPQFFKDYSALEEQLNQFGDGRLTKKGAEQKKWVQKSLKDAEKWFTHQLFLSNQSQASNYQNELQTWLHQHNKNEAVKSFNTRHQVFHGVKLFSVLAGIFMGLGTTYLMLEGFAAIPLLASIPLGLLPVIILPLAINAGIAYALLIYNATTSMIHNDTLRKWYFKIRDDLRAGITLPKIGMALLSVVLVGLAVGLTLCTAGTWWTVANNARPLFQWMKGMPSFIMGVINPIITGASALIFNLENTHETFEIIHESATSKHEHEHEPHQSTWQKLRQRENLLQLLNPARIVLLLTITPLRILMFLGHLISIGVTADRVPGISEIISAILGIISEGFEDLHYVYNHHHAHTIEESRKERLSSAHGHSHDTDIPTIVLKLAFSPVYVLATLWAFGTSQFNKTPLSLKEAFFQQIGFKPAKDMPLEESSLPSTSESWKQEQIIFVLEREKQKRQGNHLFKSKLTPENNETLSHIQQQVRNTTHCADTITKGNYARFFNGDTKQLLDTLPKRVGMSA